MLLGLVAYDKENPMVRDAAQPIFEHFSRTTLGRLAQSDVDALVATHAANPFGPHPDELARVLNVFRAQGTRGKDVILSLPDEAGWRVATITGRREEGSVTVTEERFESIEEAEHAIFLRRLRAAGLAPEPGAE
jgi:branched-chain amino acid transport system permease protein